MGRGERPVHAHADAAAHRPVRRAHGQSLVRPGRPARRRRRARRAARLRLAAGARPVRPAGARRRRRQRRRPRVLRRGATSSPSRSATRSGPPTSACGSRCTRSPTARSSPACPGCTSTSSDQVHSLLGGIDPDPGLLFDAIGRAADALRVGRNPIDERGLVGSVRERRTARRDGPRAGADVAARRARQRGDEPARRARWWRVRRGWRRVLSSRRNAAGRTALLHRLMGLEMKMRQYEVGEAFVDAVTERGRVPGARRRVVRPGGAADPRRAHRTG